MISVSDWLEHVVAGGRPQHLCFEFSVGKSLVFRQARPGGNTIEGYN